MKLAGFTIHDVIYAVDETVVARAQSEKGERVVLKYQDCDRPSAALLARWQHEHAVLESIDSEWVIKSLGIRQVENSLILVLEDFGSSNLAQLITRLPVNISERIAIAIQLASAISAVHSHGLIHGDISTKNVLVNVSKLSIKLCDFGLASRLGQQQKNMDDSLIRGALEYMSPEQTGRTNLVVDYRSDLYSLGVCLYELFLGRKPFQSHDPMALLHAQIAIMPTPLHELDPAIPEAISAIVQKLLAKFPDDRYQSSFGLLHDLNLCQKSWQQLQRIEPFALAQADIPERFCVSQKLYGREAESAAILAAFERAANGRAELLLISGYSGIGKTALVNELHRPITARRGYFIHGKCDQYRRNQPYAALFEAFQQLLHQLLAEGEERRRYWKQTLLEALGENASSVAEILPDLILLIGTPPTMPALPAAEMENRFHLAFAQFVKALASRQHPLMMFLDDLQWSDAPTQRLLRHLVKDDDARCLLIVGAYRDNEIDELHPLHLTIQSIERVQGRVEQLKLGNLGLSEVYQMIADTLHRQGKDIAALASLCMEKTQGNPFFLGQLLRSLNENNSIHYDRADGVWHWNIDQIRQRGVTDNVVALMLQNIRLLDPNTQYLLALAAHLGHSFDLRLLMAVSGQDAVNTANALWPALHAGLVLPLDENYKFEHSTEKLEDSRYRFLHDRVQQAAYDLTPPDERQSMQLRCGRLLLANSSEAELGDRLFIVLGSLNSAIELITDDQERAALLALNLRGGSQAKSASAFPDAVSLLRRAKSLLTANAWETQPEQTLVLYRELAEAEYLAGNFEQAEHLCLEGIAACTGVIAKVTLILVQADMFHIQGRFAESYPVLCAALELLGRPFPATEEEVGKIVVGEFEQTEQMLSRYSQEQLLNAGEMTDVERHLEMRVYLAMSFSSYQSSRFNAFVLDACRMVQTILRHGQCDLSSIAYVGYTTAMAAMKKPYPLCYQMGKLALTIAEQRDNRYCRVTVYQYYSSFFQHWCEPLPNTFPYLEKSLEIGQSGINQLSAGYSALMGADNKFVFGVALDELQLECEAGLKFLQKSQQPNTENMLRYGVLQPLLALRGTTLQPTSFDTASCSSTDFFNGNYQTPSLSLSLHISAKIRHGYLLGDATLWQQGVDHIDMIAMALPDSAALVQAHFFAALGMLKMGMADAETKSVNLQAVEREWESFKTWANDNPENFSYQALLIEAELAHVRDQDMSAMDIYARAIDAATGTGSLFAEALTNELFADFWAARHQRQLASNFIREAYYHYRRWGAEVKCKQLETRWPNISFRLSEQRFQYNEQSRSHRSVSEHTGLLDLHSLLKANQLLAKEIHLESLLQKMLEVMLENAGAQFGAIVLNEDEHLVVEAAGGVVEANRVDIQRIGKPLQDLCAGEQPMLPAVLIEYAKLTRATLLLNNPVADERFSRDGYLAQRQPKSVMCLPIVSQGKLVALVYMENNLMENVFTSKHQHMLELLCSQAAISLVNARLYESLEEKVLQRTDELRQISMQDGLSGIANRRSFDERLDIEWRRGLRSQRPLSLLMIDIDHFKLYNDHYGHFEGDYCIKAVAGLLTTLANRPGDLVARYGGEEFTILLPDTDAPAAVKMAEACLMAMAALAIAHQNSPVAHCVSLSIGICTLQVAQDAESSTLITRADQALYQAKHEGRNRYCVFDVNR